MHRWPKDHPLWPVVYMLVGSGCLMVMMFWDAQDLSDGSEVSAAVKGLTAAGGVGWLVKKIFSA